MTIALEIAQWCLLIMMPGSWLEVISCTQWVDSSWSTVCKSCEPKSPLASHDNCFFKKQIISCIDRFIYSVLGRVQWYPSPFCSCVFFFPSPVKVSLVGAVLFTMQHTSYLPVTIHDLMLFYTAFLVFIKVRILKGVSLVWLVALNVKETFTLADCNSLWPCTINAITILSPDP